MTSNSEARVPTELSRRYLGQMCSHFGHRRPVSNEGATGRIAFEGGDCVMRAEVGVLVLRIEASDEASRTRLEDVAARHLERFMFRETPTIAWLPEGGSTEGGSTEAKPTQAGQAEAG